MRTRAQIRFLRDDRARSDFNFSQRVDVRPVAQAGAVVQRQVPRNGNPRPLMNEGHAVNFGLKEPQPNEAPRIGRLRRPGAKQEPAIFPEDAPHQLVHRPGRGELRALPGIDVVQRFRHSLGVILEQIREVVEITLRDPPELEFSRFRVRRSADLPESFPAHFQYSR